MKPVHCLHNIGAAGASATETNAIKTDIIIEIRFQINFASLPFL
jgi:hypothetical protein